jgi:membrane protein
MKSLKQSFIRFKQENMTDRAAALTFYAVLSLFPGLLVVVGLVGLLGQYPETTDRLLEIVGRLGPESAIETFRGPIESVVRNKGGAGAIFGVGLIAALWSASGYVGAFMRTADEIHEVPRQRRLLRALPVRVGLTILMAVLLAAAAVALVVTGPLAEAIGDTFGLRSTVVTIWSIGKWPLLIALVAIAFSVLYYAAPNARQSGFRSVIPGAIVAVLLWIVASVGLALYVANFGSYNKTYGSIAGMIVALLWLYVTNLAIVFGALVNVERERIRLGVPFEEPMEVDLRDPKGKDVAFSHKDRSPST